MKAHDFFKSGRAYYEGMIIIPFSMTQEAREKLAEEKGVSKLLSRICYDHMKEELATGGIDKDSFHIDRAKGVEVEFLADENVDVGFELDVDKSGEIVIRPMGDIEVQG